MLIHIVVVDVLGDVSEQLAADLIGGAVEDDDVDRHIVFHEELANSVHRHAQRLVLGISVDSGRDQRERNSSALVGLRQRKARPIAGNELFLFSVLTAVPYRADCMYHILAWQAVRPGDLGVTGLAAAQSSALSQQLWPRCSVYTAIHAATA